MKLLVKFSIVYSVLIAVMLCVAGVIAYNVLTANARAETEAQAKMITDYARAARTYTDAQIAPVSLSNRNGVFRSQWIPFYGATQIFSYVHANYPNYTYKEAALNPTNQRDRAVDWEADIINAFGDNPSLKLLSGDRPLLAGSAMYVASPIVATANCLSCHGVPSAAPRGMVALYGTNNGFGWKNGEIIGAEIVSVPTTVPARCRPRGLRQNDDCAGRFCGHRSGRARSRAGVAGATADQADRGTGRRYQSRKDRRRGHHREG
jgi:hypothetical protein